MTSRAISFLLLSLFFYGLPSGFSQALESTTTYNKKTLPAVVQEFPFTAEVLEETVVEELKKRGFTGKAPRGLLSNKGFWEFKGVLLPELGTEERLDLYIKFEKKGRKDAESGVITFLIAKGYDNFVGRSTDPKLVDAVKKFSESMFEPATAVALEKDIQAQEETIKKAEKKYQNLVEEGVNMEKRKQKLEQDIQENKQAQSKQTEEVSAQKKALEQLKLKRKTSG